MLYEAQLDGVNISGADLSNALAGHITIRGIAIGLAAAGSTCTRPLTEADLPFGFHWRQSPERSPNARDPLGPTCPKSSLPRSAYPTRTLQALRR
jgi:hypothetical protein